MKLTKKVDCDLTVKAVLIGDSGVGKTNILLRFCDNSYQPSYNATIGVDFRIKIIEINDLKIKIQIWDTAGQQKFKNIAPTFYKGSIAIILTYSITQDQTFESIESWIKQIYDNSSSDVLIYLVGNKLDMRDERKVDQLVGQKLADKYGMTFMEVSAKDGTRVNELFENLGHKIYDKIKKSEGGNEKENKKIVLKKEAEEPQGGCSC